MIQHKMMFKKHSSMTNTCCLIIWGKGIGIFLQNVMKDGISNSINYMKNLSTNETYSSA